MSTKKAKIAMEQILRWGSLQLCQSLVNELSEVGRRISTKIIKLVLIEMMLC